MQPPSLKKPRRVFSAGLSKKIFLDPHGMSVYAYGGGGGVHLIFNPDAAKHLEDVFVLDVPGPRSAYFIPSLHADMLRPVSGGDGEALDYGGWQRESLGAGPRKGAAPARSEEDAARLRHGFPGGSPLSIRSLMTASGSQQWRVGDQVTASAGDSVSSGGSFAATFLGYLNPPSGHVYSYEGDAPGDMSLVPLFVNPAVLRVEGAELLFLLYRLVMLFAIVQAQDC